MTNQTQQNEIDQMAQEHIKHGGTILFTHPTSTGNHTNGYGNGSIDISLPRVASKYSWLDLGHVYFTNPNNEQVLQAATASSCSDEWIEGTNYGRRLSFKQAQYVNKVICDSLANHFGSEIPSDVELPQFIINATSQKVNDDATLTAAEEALESIGKTFEDDKLDCHGQLGMITKEEFETLKATVAALQRALG